MCTDRFPSGDFPYEAAMLSGSDVNFIQSYRVSGKQGKNPNAKQYYFDDYTDRLPEYLAMWKKLNLSFDGIMSGFLGSAEQIGMVESFIKTFRKEHTIVVVDPVMGDHGSISSVYTEEMCLLMRRLVSLADIDRRLQIDGCALPGSWLDAEGVTPDGRTSDGLWTAEGGYYRNSTGRVYREFHV